MSPTKMKRFVVFANYPDDGWTCAGHSDDLHSAVLIRRDARRFTTEVLIYEAKVVDDKPVPYYREKYAQVQEG